MFRLESSHRESNNRELYRMALREAIDSDHNVLIKDKLVSISSNKTNYSIFKFKKDIQFINKRLNQRLIHRRKYKRSPNRIVFWCFFEKSKGKLLTHTHMILRVPVNLKDYVDTIIEKTIRRYLPSGFSLVISHQQDAIGYSTKYYSNIFRDEMFEVF
jgi:hypothetical protein